MTHLACPSCGRELHLIPKRRGKCKVCGEAFGLNNNGRLFKPLVTAKQEAAERAFGRLEGYGVSKADYRRVAADLAEQFGHDAQAGDVIWRLFQRAVARSDQGGRPKAMAALVRDRATEERGRRLVGSHRAIAEDGIRRGELLRLRRLDVSLEAATLVVEHGKSRRARRMLPLEGEIVALLRGFLAAFPAEGSASLFSFSAKQLRHVWEAIRVEAQLDDGEVVWHTFRHTYGVHCALARTPIPELQVRMGQEDTKTTMRYAAYVPAQRTSHYTVALATMGLEVQQVPTFGPTVTEHENVTNYNAETSLHSA